jgi:hypothetical protein
LVAFRRFVADRFGRAAAEQLFPKDRLDARKGYPYAVFDDTLAACVGLTGHPRDRLLRELGAHAITTFFALYPGSFPAQGARRFLVQVEQAVDQRLKELLPEKPPRPIAVTDLGSGQLRLEYRSARDLCPLVFGLLDGTSVHYQTPMRYSEETCRRKGDQVCAFMVEVQRTQLPRTKPRRR